MRAFLLVAIAASLVVPSVAPAQRAAGAASAGAPRSRAAGDGRSRAVEGARPRGTTPTTTATPRPPVGAPGAWAGGDGPRELRPVTPYRPAPYRPAPYGSPPHRPGTHRPVPRSPYAPYGHLPFGYRPYGYYGYFGYDGFAGLSYRVPGVVIVTPAVIPAAPAAPAEPAAEAYAPAAPRGQVLVVGGGAGAPLLDVEAAGDTLLRLRWTGAATDVQEVTLLLLDADRTLLAAQTLREAPYTALFDRPPRAAFAGVSVSYASGASATTVVPLTPDRAPRD